MTQQELNKLQERLTAFGKTLTAEQCTEFRSILFALHGEYYALDCVYKYAEIALIPSNNPTLTETSTTSHLEVPVPMAFRPAAKKDLTSIALTLAKNLDLQLKQKKKE